jgi:hypothetical protein
VWVVAWGGLEESDGVTLPEPKNDPVLCEASSLILDETPRVAPGVTAPLLAPPPPCPKPRTTTERTPKPTTAAPAEASFRIRARRRAGARREVEEVACDMSS